jgi:hypothetical protein
VVGGQEGSAGAGGQRKGICTMKNMNNDELADRLDHIRWNVDEWNHPITAAADLDEAARRLRIGIHVDEDVLFWAFRYCLKRKSYAVSDGVRAVISNWSVLRLQTKKRIHEEIKDHLSKGESFESDHESWSKVLELPVEP